MAKEFYSRLKEYYINVGKVLRGQAATSSIFPNPTDVGISREKIYANFLSLHLPTACNVSYGGYLFNFDGDESKQIDIIITNDICPQYKFCNQDSSGKSFSCIEGTIAVVSVKSNLSSSEIVDALNNMASLPDKKPLDNRKLPLLKIPSYEDWPYKIVYASNGISSEALLQTIDRFYSTNASIPFIKRPNIIHVAGQYNIMRVPPSGSITLDGTKIGPNIFYPQKDTTDVYALTRVISEIQMIALSSRYIIFTYGEIIDKIMVIGAGNSVDAIPNS